MCEMVMRFVRSLRDPSRLEEMEVGVDVINRPRDPCHFWVIGTSWLQGLYLH